MVRIRCWIFVFGLVLLLPGLSVQAGWWTFFFPAEDAPVKGQEATITGTAAARELVEEVSALALHTRDPSQADVHLAIWETLPNYVEGSEELAHGIRRFISQTLEVRLDQLVIERYLNPGDVSEGVSEDPLFFVRKRGGGLVAVVKAFFATPENLRGFAQELSSLSLLESLDLRESELVSVLSVGRLVGDGEEYALMAMSAAPGVSVTRHFRSVGREEIDSRVRGDRRATLHKAVAALGRAMAEVHTRRVVSNGEVASIFWQMDSNWMQRFLVELELQPDLCPISPEIFFDYYVQMRGRARTHRHGVSFIHADAHTGNYLYDSATDTLTIIDLGRFSWSVDAKGMPHGPPMYDFVWADCFMLGVGTYYGLTDAEIAEARRLFQRAYERFPGVEPFCEECLDYHRFVFWASTVVAYLRPTAGYTPEMRQQMQSFIEVALQQLAQLVNSPTVDRQQIPA